MKDRIFHSVDVAVSMLHCWNGVKKQPKHRIKSFVSLLYCLFFFCWVSEAQISKKQRRQRRMKVLHLRKKRSDCDYRKYPSHNSGCAVPTLKLLLSFYSKILPLSKVCKKKMVLSEVQWLWLHSKSGYIRLSYRNLHYGSVTIA